MIDKIQKIKEWISKKQDGLMDAQGNFGYPEHEGAYNVLCNLDAYIDSLQEEPVSKPIDFEKELYKAFGQVKDFTLGMRIAKWFYDMGKNSHEPVSEELEKAARSYSNKLENICGSIGEQTRKAFKAGAEWQKENEDIWRPAEHIDWIEYQLNLRLQDTLDYNGIKVDRADFIKDFKQAIKEERI